MADNNVFNSINKRLDLIVLWFNIYTFVVWGMFLLQFFTNNKIELTTTFMGVYIAFLTAYTSQKEASRWQLGKCYSRHGEIWVYVWLTTGIILFPAKGIFKERFFVPLTDLATILGFVITYFTASEYSKKAYKSKKGA